MVRNLLAGLVLLGAAVASVSAHADTADAAAEEAERQRWNAWKLEVLRRQKKDLQIGGPAAGIAFSVLGIAAGSWMLSFGAGSPRVSDDSCAGGDDVWGGGLEGLCFSGSAPYAGTVLIGISILGLARAGKKLKRRAKRRRQIQASIRELSRNAH